MKGIEKAARIYVCGGQGCVSSGCRNVLAAMRKAIFESPVLSGKYQVVETGCIGSCDLGPVVVVDPEKTLYAKVKESDVPEIVSEHLLGQRPVERLMYVDPTTKKVIATIDEMPFFTLQKKVVLRNCGVVDPTSIDEYIRNRGYEALRRAVTQMTPEAVIEAVKVSGLRGRGGAGFPTGKKWEFARKYQGRPKYVICNADEGDPGAFMDRSVLEGDPHSVIEGMALAAYAIGAEKGYFYVRAEYPLALERLELALDQARNLGFLGEHLLGTGFSFDAEIRVGAGAFVCGEETALLASIEGNRGTPRPRPPFPAEKGLWERPTVINNVETLANVTAVMLEGPQWYANIGTEKSKGTKVFALAGKIVNTGLVEVPMGTTLRQIIFDIGGGIPSGGKFKAAQTGGPSGGCIPAEFLDTPVDYESLAKLGAIMGSGGMVIMDENTCMVDVARFFLEFTSDESCGKCTPCREGTAQMLAILKRITGGKGKPSDIDRLERLAKLIKSTALCGLGQTAPNPVLSTLKYFREEYEAHVNEGICPAGVCKSLFKYEIDPSVCTGCGACRRACPVEAISGEVKKPHIIDQEECTKCGTCQAKCKFAAIRKVTTRTYEQAEGDQEKDSIPAAKDKDMEAAG
jgi:NADH:ubiquinone oxidoreductase subunit F (NADH-binding)/(2Fe-2S) ferredoxin/Pyruvate/2-oxoacid:ferredoxin oxidoreductase delta subunit